MWRLAATTWKVLSELIVQTVPSELVHVPTRAVAALWIYATGSLDRGGVARDGDCAPRVAFAVAVKIDIERAIGPAGPDGAERVGPGAGERGLSRARISGAGVDQHQNDAGEKDFKGALCFHAIES